jgi:uncharacterized membrane protein YecN with MAPEG domain
MSERQHAREDLDELDIRVVWFGFLPSYLFLTLLLILFIAVFGGHVAVVGFPSLVPLVISVVTVFGGALCLSVRSASSKVESATIRRNSDDADTDAEVEFLAVMPTIARIPTWIVGVVLLATNLTHLAGVGAQTGSVSFTVIAAETLIALTLGMVLGVQATLEVIAAEGGKIPDGLSSRLWNVRPEAMTASLMTDSTEDDFDP